MDLLWDVASKTALVLAAMYGVLLLARRFWGGPGALRGKPLMSVVQSAHLGPGRSVHLIGVGGRMLLVGATSQQVSLLTEMEASELEAAEEVAVRKASFEQYLSRAAEIVGATSARLKARQKRTSSELESHEESSR